MNLGTKSRPTKDDTLLQVLKSAKSIFEQQSMRFQGFWSSRKYIDPWFWKQKSGLILILKQIWIWDRFWSDLGTTLCPKSGSKSIQNRVWKRPCFWNHFWTLLREPESKWIPRKWHFRGGGYEGTKGGSNNVTRLSSAISWGKWIYTHICMNPYITTLPYPSPRLENAGPSTWLLVQKMVL